MYCCIREVQNAHTQKKKYKKLSLKQKENYITQYMPSSKKKTNNLEQINKRKIAIQSRITKLELKIRKDKELLQKIEEEYIERSKPENTDEKTE
jgi:hypothetical protein